MKKTLIAIVATILLFLLAKSFFEDPSSEYLRRKNLTMTELKEFTLKAENKIIILNFWATWCQPCQEEFPYILDILEAFQDTDIKLIAIAIDSLPEDILTFKKPFEKRLDQLEDKIIISHNTLKSLKEKLRIFQLPESYLIYKGKVIKKISRPEEWKEESLQTFFSMMANYD